MKAAFYDKYGSADVLTIKDVPHPEVANDQVLVQVFATAVTTADWRLRASAFPGVLWLPGRMMAGLTAPRNKVPGTDFAGRVTAIGKDVTRLREGDAVFGFAGRGAHAEYLAIPQDGVIAAKPVNLGYEEAAAVPFGALSALVFLQDFAKVEPGQRVLITGASGGVGVFAVQLAKHLGAEVTGVCSTGNVELVRSLGADRVIDYTLEDFAAGGATYDVILDTVGATSFSRCKRALAARGRYVPLEFGLREIAQSLTSRVTGGPRVVVGISADRRQDLAFIGDLLAEGAIRPVIDAEYPLERIAEAHRRVESRHKRGSVVVTVAESGALRVAG